MARQFKHEDVATVPRGYKVRTVKRGGSEVRLAFPPGARKRGSGKLISILHPKKSGKGNPKKTVTREQAEAKQQKAVKFLRDVVDDPGKADEIEDLSVEEYAARKHLTLSNPKGKRRRGKNPNGDGDAAAQIYEDFHGEVPRKVIEFQQQQLRDRNLAALGKLIELTLPDLGVRIDFEKDNVLLCSNSEGNQVYFVGGNQDLSGVFEKVSDDSKEMLNLGRCSEVVYRARKGFDGFNESDYKHKMGEGGYEKPMLIYDQENKQMHFAGGEYEVKPEGIVH